MDGRNDIHEIDPDNFFEMKGPNIHSLDDYLKAEAQRPRILISTIEKQVFVSKLCLQMQNLLKKSKIEYKISVEGIYSMAMIKIVADYFKIGQVFMPLYRKHLKDIDEVDIYPEADGKLVILFFIDGVFTEMESNDAMRLYEDMGWELAQCGTKKANTEDDTPEEKMDQSTMNSMRGKLYELLGSEWAYITNPKKAVIANGVYNQLCTVLSGCDADYTIEINVEPPLGQIEIQVVTDILDAAHQRMDIYKNIISNVDIIHQNIYGRKVVMTFIVNDVFIEVKTGEEEDCEFDEDAGLEFDTEEEYEDAV
ncbi:MAG: hypothetical protein FWG31_03695 [Oscillospiraceae bacterium]|nr:hypothetical protein [Oscillospiraceae bacterium]